LDIEGAREYIEKKNVAKKLHDDEAPHKFDWVDQYAFPLGVRYLQSYYEYFSKH